LVLRWAVSCATRREPWFPVRLKVWVKCWTSFLLGHVVRCLVGIIAGTHREERSVVSRVNFLETEPGRIADVARVVCEVVHPAISGEDDYAGYIVLGNRETGKALGVTLWSSDEARETSDSKARQIRPRLEEATGGTMRSVEPYEVLFFDVREAQPKAE
jgi:hypothetical protein